MTAAYLAMLGYGVFMILYALIEDARIVDKATTITLTSGEYLP